MVETTENQISSSSSSSFYVLKACLVFVALALVVVPCIVWTSFLGFGWFYPMVFTVSILILSTSFLVSFTKKMRKVVLVENAASIKLQVEKKVVMESVSESGAAQQADISIVNEFQVDSLDLTTTTTTTTTENERSENVELNWAISGNVEQNPEILYDSASESEDDEEGLIEIAIPSNKSNSLSEESKSSSLPNFLPESILCKQQQQDLDELLAEMNEVNEEENLIEIDISIGSIKCPRSKIEA